VEYLGQNFAGEGTMTDRSGEGMKILGTHAAHTGMRLALQLLAGESAIPIQILCPYVRWTRNQEFGVKFGPMEPAVKAQLQDLLSTLQGSPTT
jgi:PilZ domain